MPYGKKRVDAHIIDNNAYIFLQNEAFPSRWVLRPVVPDYGIDYDLELFEFEDDICVTLGEHVFLQVKGTENPQYCKQQTFGSNIFPSFDISAIKYSIDVSLLSLIERMGSAIPVLLIVVDLKSQVSYWICLNDYIKHILPYQNPNYKEQGHITVYIPTDNKLSKSNQNVCLWYGKRAKLYSLFHELLSAIDTIEYDDSSNIVKNTEKLIDDFLYYDAWNAKESWYMLDAIYSYMIEMKCNNMILKAFSHLSEKLIEFDHEDSSVISTEQFFSCNHLIDLIKAANSELETHLRHIGLPSNYNYMSHK